MRRNKERGSTYFAVAVGKVKCLKNLTGTSPISKNGGDWEGRREPPRAGAERSFGIRDDEILMQSGRKRVRKKRKKKKKKEQKEKLKKQKKSSCDRYQK